MKVGKTRSNPPAVLWLAITSITQGASQVAAGVISLTTSKLFFSFFQFKSTYSTYFVWNPRVFICYMHTAFSVFHITNLSVLIFAVQFFRGDRCPFYRVKKIDGKSEIDWCICARGLNWNIRLKLNGGYIFVCMRILHMPFELFLCPYPAGPFLF